MKRVGLTCCVCLVLVWTSGQAGGFPGLALTRIDGTKIYLDSLVAKGPVVLNFWATWCAPCRRELPQLEKAYKEFGPKGVAFAAISLDRRASKSLFEKFSQDRGLTLPLYTDSDGILADKFGVMSIPTTFVFSFSGETVLKTRGYRSGDEVMLEKKLQELIQSKGRPASQAAK